MQTPITKPNAVPAPAKQSGLRNLKISHTTMRRLFNIYGPFVGAGVKVREISADFLFIRVEMRLRWFNRNYVNTHFGGSLYAMTDPFYVYMLINTLGKNYIVWDKAAEIQFRSPGKGMVWCEFRLTAEQIADIKATADSNGKTEPTFRIDVFGEDGKLVASILKTVYVRKVV
jgi:acyl-coenzyme A thioesterase PaaI-like protein